MHILEHTGSLLSVLKLGDDNQGVQIATVVAHAGIDCALKLLVYTILLGSIITQLIGFTTDHREIDQKHTYSSRNSSGTGSVNW